MECVEIRIWHVEIRIWHVQIRIWHVEIRGATPDPGSRFFRPLRESGDHGSPRATIWAGSRQTLQ